MTLKRKKSISIVLQGFEKMKYTIVIDKLHLQLAGQIDGLYSPQAGLSPTSIVIFLAGENDLLNQFNQRFVFHAQLVQPKHVICCSNSQSYLY